MIEIAAIVACVILAGLGIFQILLAAGLPIGHFAWGGKYKVLPRNLRVASIISVLTYVLFATIILEESGLISIISSNNFSSVGVWVLAGYFFIGIIMNAISRSKPEQLVMTPIVTILSGLFLFVALQ